MVGWQSRTDSGGMAVQDGQRWDGAVEAGPWVARWIGGGGQSAGCPSWRDKGEVVAVEGLV